MVWSGSALDPTAVAGIRSQPKSVRKLRLTGLAKSSNPSASTVTLMIGRKIARSVVASAVISSPTLSSGLPTGDRARTATNEAL
jgi:hypothetical protein